MYTFYDNPKHLTRKPLNGSFKNNSINSTDYIFTESELEHVQNKICSEIKSSTTILEFCGKLPIRHDSNISSIAHRASCDIFRTCFGDGKCRTCDEDYAIHMFDVDINSIRDGQSLLKNDDHSIDDKYSVDHMSLKPVWRKKQYNGENTLFVEYDCPILGYRELMFPIILDNKTIAVLFVGQIKLEGKKKFIRGQKERYFNQHQYELENYFIKNPRILDNGSFKYNITIDLDDNLRHCLKSKLNINTPTYNQIMKSINSNDVNLNFEISKEQLDFEIIKDQIIREKSNDSNSMHHIQRGLKRDILKNNEYDDLIKSIIVQLKIFQSSIRDNIKKNIKQYLPSTTMKIVNEFHKDLSNINKKIDERTKKYFWDKIVNITLERLTEKLGLKFVKLFGDNDIADTSKLNLVSQSGEVKNSISYSHFDIDMLKNSEANENIELSSIEFPILFDFLDNQDNQSDRNDSILLYFPLQFSLNKSMVILFQFKNTTSNIVSDVLPVLCKELYTIMAFICTAYASIDTLNESTNVKKLISIYRHEIAHHVQGLSRINNQYFDNYDKYYSRNLIDLKNAYSNFTSILERMLYISKNTRFLYDNPNINITEIQIIKDIFRKFINIYAKELRMQFKKIELPDYHNDANVLRKIETDENLIDLIVNNIISNAVKYSHWGTKIYIDIRKNNNRKVLSIKNYGIQIYEKGFSKKDVYKLYMRNINAKRIDPNGAGIGMHVCAQLTKLLGYKMDFIEHSISSEYHVPFLNEYMQEYIRQENLYKSNSITQSELNSFKHPDHIDIKSQYKSLKNDGSLLKILNTGEMNPHAKRDMNVIKEMIKRPTYEITCEVEIK